LSKIFVKTFVFTFPTFSTLFRLFQSGTLFFLPPPNLEKKATPSRPVRKTRLLMTMPPVSWVYDFTFSDFYELLSWFWTLFRKILRATPKERLSFFFQCVSYNPFSFIPISEDQDYEMAGSQCDFPQNIAPFVCFFFSL